MISTKTANDVLSMMETVVAQGTGKNAKVEGYRIGGKTGTSEDGVNTNKYVTSFIGTAPISDPQVVVLIVLYQSYRSRRTPRRWCSCTNCISNLWRGFTIS